MKYYKTYIKSKPSNAECSNNHHKTTTIKLNLRKQTQFFVTNSCCIIYKEFME